MPRDFNSIEYGDRLTRALVSRGRTSLAIDETVVPVAQVLDATQAPYRRSGRKFYVHHLRMGTGLAGHAWYLRNLGPGACVVDYIMIQDRRSQLSGSIVNTGGTPDPYAIPLLQTVQSWRIGTARSSVIAGALAASGGSITLVANGFSTELLVCDQTTGPGSGEVQNLPMQLWQLLGGGVQLTIDFNNLWAFSTFPQEKVSFSNVDLVIPVGLPLPTQFCGVYIENVTAVDEDCSVTIAGRYFDDIPAPKQ